MYALRHTHITWARKFIPYDAVRAQVGHAGRDIEEIHYNDESFVDAAASSSVVWEVLTGAKSLERPKDQPAVLTTAMGEVAPVSAPEDLTNKNFPQYVNGKVLSALNVVEMKGVGIEPTTNGLKGRCSTD